MPLLDADGRGRHASVGVAIGGIARPSSRLADVRSGTSNEAVDGSVLSPVVVALCFPVAESDLKKLCLKKLDNGFEAPPSGKDDEAWPDNESVFLNALSTLVLDVVAAVAAAEVL